MTKHSNKTLRVLLVEDELLMRWSLAAALADDGHVVTEAEDGGSALRILQSGPSVDAIILDYRLPDSTSLRLLSEMRRLASETPVILITAYGTAALARAARRAGAFEVLEKPFDVYEIGPLLERARAA